MATQLRAGPQSERLAAEDGGGGELGEMFMQLEKK